jgi:hypothetical protein
MTVLQLKSLSAVRMPPVNCEIDTCEIGGAHSGVVKIQFSWDVTPCGGRAVPDVSSYPGTIESSDW